VNVQPLGLSVHEAETRLAQSGPNEIARERPTSVWKLLRSQFVSPLVLLLIAACAVSAWLGEVADAVAIGAIVLINGIVGFLQEHRCSRSCSRRTPAVE
jgi:Ca2+-transporting ATPase